MCRIKKNHKKKESFNIIGQCYNWDTKWDPNIGFSFGQISKVEIRQHGDMNGYQGNSITVLYGHVYGFKCLLPRTRITGSHSIPVSGHGNRCSGYPISDF